MHTMAPLMAALPAVGPRPSRCSAAGAAPCAAPLLGCRAALRGAPVVAVADAPPSRGSVAASSGRGVVQVVASREVGVGIMGNKAGMTSYFTTNGMQVPVTVIALLPGNVVTQVKTPATDGYSAVQVGYNQTYAAKINKPEAGHLAKSGAPPLRELQEFRLESVDGFTVGQQLQAEALFKPGDLVDVQGTSVGKGFQGGTKRYGFARGLMTHGSKSHRAPGAIGGNTAGRVYSFQRMPGRMGGGTVKVRKLEVIRVTNDCILVKGSVPGKPGNILRVTPAKIVGKNLKQL